MFQLPIPFVLNDECIFMLNFLGVLQNFFKGIKTVIKSTLLIPGLFFCQSIILIFTNKFASDC